LPAYQITQEHQRPSDRKGIAGIPIYLVKRAFFWHWSRSRAAVLALGLLAVLGVYHMLSACSLQLAAAHRALSPYLSVLVARRSRI
jgi:hypothetical protein